MNKTSKSVEYKQSVLIIDVLNEPSAFVVAGETKIAHIFIHFFLQIRKCVAIMYETQLFIVYILTEIFFSCQILQMYIVKV